MDTVRGQHRSGSTPVGGASHVFELIVGVVGYLIAAVGAWMYYVRADGWLGGLSKDWYLGLLVAAGLLLTVSFATLGTKEYRTRDEWTGSALLSWAFALMSFGAAAGFAIVWLW